MDADSTYNIIKHFESSDKQLALELVQESSIKYKILCACISKDALLLGTNIGIIHATPYTKKPNEPYDFALSAERHYHKDAVMKIQYEATNDTYISLSLDQTIQVWKYSSMSTLRTKVFKEFCSCFDVSSNGEYIAFGLLNNSIQIASFTDMENIMFQKQIDDKPISIRFEPTMKPLRVLIGGRRGEITILEIINQKYNH